VNIVWAALVIAAVTAPAVAAMLLVRRRAPEGSYFADGDRAAGVFGVLATGFSVLLGFIVFLAFESYDQSRAGAEEEALVLAQQVETAQFLPQPAADKLTGELGCYGRSVVYLEWPRAESGDLGDDINPWGAELFRTLDGRPAYTERAVCLRQMARPDLGARGGSDRPHPRRGRRHSNAAVGRPAVHRRRDLRLHAVLRRPG
jgi:hypothetical protein